jgi:hypothetical protein
MVPQALLPQLTDHCTPPFDGSLVTVALRLVWTLSARLVGAETLTAIVDDEVMVAVAVAI